MVLFSREPIEFETAAYLSVCVMEKSIYVSAGGWDKSFVFYDDGVMNSQNNTTTKKALTPFLTNQEPGQSHKQSKGVRVCVVPLFRSFSPLFSNETIHTRSKTHHNNTSIKYLI